MSLVIPFFIRVLSCDKMSEESRDESLVVHPPQLHIMLKLLTGAAKEIAEIIYAAMLLIPADIKRPIKYI